MMELNNTKLIAGIFILLMAVGTTYFIMEGDNAYYCEDTNLVGLCDSLSKVNDVGTQTRCYFTNENNKSTYKICKNGWIKYENLNVIGEPINDSFNYFEAKFDKETIKKLNKRNITKVEVSSCVQVKPNLCIAILNISEDTFKELLINPLLYNTTEEIEAKIIEEAKIELAKLVVEEPEVIEITNPIILDLKEI